MAGLIRRRRRHVVGATAGALVPLLIGAGVRADDLTVSSTITNDISTSNPTGVGPGNITISAGGAVSVGDQFPVTINTSNMVNNAGTITSTAETGAIGIQANTNGQTNLNSGIINSNTISIPGPATTSSNYTINDYNEGIGLNGTGTFTGTITNSGSISVGGQQSYGIAISAPLIGDILQQGTITVPGTSSTGLFTTAPITGNITNSGTISATGTGSVGIYVGNTVTGTIIQSGTISVGNSALFDANGNAVAPNSGTAGIWIAGSVNGGVLTAGDGYTQAQQAANTSISTTGNSTTTGIGNAPGILVMPGGSGGFHNIVVGERPDTPFAIVNNSVISGTANYAGVNAYGIIVGGAVNNGTLYTSTLQGGIYNAGGNINASALDATATGVQINAGGVVPELRNTGDILVSTTDDTANNDNGVVGTKGGPAYGVVVQQGGVLNTFSNYGRLIVTSQGPNSSYGVVDNSGTLTTFYNSGIIQPIIDQLSTGTITAVDLRANTTGVNFTNTNQGDIIGPVYLGSGTNTFTMSTAQQTGNLSFVGGNSTLSLTNSSINGNVNLGAGVGTSSVSLTNSTINGGLTSSSGNLNLALNQASVLNIPDSKFVNVTNATIDGTSQVKFGLNGASLGNGGEIVATGAVTVANNASLTPVFTGIFANPTTVPIVTAGTLNLGASPASLVTPNVSYMNSYTATLNPANPNILDLNVSRKTAAQMGLDPNMTSVYNGAIGALLKDSGVATALQAQPTRSTFLSAFRQLMPDVTDATRQVALAAQDMTLGAVRRRLSGIADTRAGEAGDRSSIWFQAMGTGADASQAGDELGYSYWGIGVGIGADAALGATTKIGVALMEMFTSISYGVSPDSPMFIYSTHANIYGRQELGPLYLQGMFGGGYSSYRETRNITIGSFTRTTLGTGDGFQGGGSLELGTKLLLGSYTLDPYLRASYLDMKRNTYTENGGGAGIDLQTDPYTQSSTRGSAGLSLERDWKLYYDSMLETDFRASYTREFHNIGDTFQTHFVADGTSFTNSEILHGPSFYSFGFGVGHKDSFSSVTLDYDAQIASHFLAHIATVTLRFRL